MFGTERDRARKTAVYMIDDSAPTTVATSLHRMRSSLSKAELKVAEVLLSNYPVAGLGNISSIARSAGVSEPTITRLVTKLGFDGFASFKSALQRELQERLLPPTEIQPLSLESSGLMDMANTMTEGMMRSLASVDQAEFAKAVRLLADPKRRVFVIGGRISSALAKHLAWSLQVLRPNVLYVSEGIAERINALLDAGKGDVVVAFDFRRYQADTVTFVRMASQQGSTAIVLTDPYLSPAAGHAEIVFHASIGGPSQFSSMVPTIAIVEAMITLVTAELGQRGRARMQRYVENSEAFGQL